MASDTAIKGSFRSNYFLAYQGLSEARVKWEMKKKKSYVYDSRQSRGWKVATGEKTFCRGVIIIETDAYGRLYDASEEIFTMEH